MKKTILLLTAVASLGMISCGGSADEASKEVCECFKDFESVMEAAGNAESMDAMMEAQKKSQEMAKCAEELKKKYDGKVSKEDLLKGMEDNCPDIAKELKKLGM